MTNNILGVGLVAVLIIAIGGWYFPAETKTVVERIKDGVGAVVGPDIYDHTRFHQNISEGGYRATTTTGSAVTLTEGDVGKNVNYLSVLPNTIVTATLPASTSASFKGLAIGDSYDVLVYNASTTAGAAITFAAGTGIDLQEDEGETVVVNGLEIARLTFVKKADTNVAAWVEVGQVGD